MAKKGKKLPSKNLVTPEFRVSYPSVFEPNTRFTKPGDKPKFEVTMLFDKKQNIKILSEAIHEVATKAFGADYKEQGIHTPLKDGDKAKQKLGYQGQWYAKTASQNRPGIVDRNKAAIVEADGTFYAGCYARAELNVYAYDWNGKLGVSLGLNHLQKLRDGEPFSNRTRAEDAFSDLEDESAEDSSNYESDSSDDEELDWENM